MIIRLKNYFSTPEKLSVLNGILLGIAVFGNVHLQAFCNPTTWAVVVIIICFTNSVIYPILIKKEKLIPIVSFINGISFCLFIYCILFLEHMNLLGLFGLFLGIGVLVYIPHFFAIQLFIKVFINLSSRVGKIFFIVGIVCSLSLPILSGVFYKTAKKDIEKFIASDYQTLNETFMTEKILGMGIIYHTSFCEFDGWRPPKHEPILNIALWLNGRKNPLNISLEKRVRLYQKFFPDKTLKFECSCATEYSENYHNDDLWKRIK